MKRKLISLVLAGTLIIGNGIAACAATPPVVEPHIQVNSFDKNVDYSAAIMDCLKDGSSYAMQLGRIYEEQRNLKIRVSGLSRYEETNYFSQYKTASEILKAMQNKKEPSYTAADLDLLARVIYAEAGCTWIPDWVQRMVGSVVLNRVDSSYYPNTIRDVIYQPGQYAPTWDGSIYKTPDARTIANAKYLLENGSVCPKNVIGQNSIITGSGVYQSYYDAILGTTIYFCYL